MHGGVGYGLAPFGARAGLLLGLAEAHADAGSDLARGYRLGMSLEAMALVRIDPRLRLLASIKGRRDFVGDISSWVARTLAASATLNRNLELRVAHSVWREHDENEATLFMHFML